MTTELEQIVASVGKALGLTESPWNQFYDAASKTNGQMHLFADERSVYDSYWQMRCRDYLLEQPDGWITMSSKASIFRISILGRRIQINCPSSEFAARAIHKLMEVRNDNSAD